MKDIHGRELYCIAWERVAKVGREMRVVQTDFAYMHANSAHLARYQFLLGSDTNVIRVVDVAPVIGYHVEDRQGMIVSV